MNKNVKYWFNESIESLKTAKILLKNQRTLECAFFCHLAIEKVLKAFIANRLNVIPPKIHNLLLLAEQSGLSKELTDEQLDFLSELNIYQLEGRYPGDRELLLKQTPTEKFTQILADTEREYLWLEQKIKSEKSSKLT
jgi:HEPN domain-containing protein